MADENQVEQTTETKETEQPVEQPTETVNTHTFSEEDVNNIVKQRLAKERASIFKKLDVDDLDTAINAVKTQKEAEEKSKIQKGEFEKLLASKNRAINPDQVVELLKPTLRLNETGSVEVLDKNGIARYNGKGETLTTDELVQEFLTQNPHFVSATPSGSGSVSNVDRTELSKPINLSDLNMNDPKDRETYAKYRQERNSKPTVIQNKP